MHVAAQDAIDGSLSDDGEETIETDETRGIHPLDSGDEWRVMHRKQRWTRMRCRQHGAQPRLAVRIKRCAGRARHGRVETDDSDTVKLDDPAQVIIFRPRSRPRMIGKTTPKPSSCVVVSWDRQDRPVQRREHLGELVVLGISPPLSEVARGEDCGN